MSHTLYAIDQLKEYRHKRNFERTAEPSGNNIKNSANPLYVMHKHAATHEHFDLRLEQNGVLRSWALPKGPSLQTGEKRLAVEVENHPLEYGGFEGVIPKGEYGGGTVMLWDVGSWQLTGKNNSDRIDFTLNGIKLKGTWTLVRMRDKNERDRGNYWLLIKRSDKPKRALHPNDLSVISNRTMDQIAHDRDHTWGTSSKRRTKPPDVKKISGARAATMPKPFTPQLATLTHQAPQGNDWLHEIKFDGYRILAFIDHGEVTLYTRSKNDWTSRFREQANRLRELPVEQAIIDGEIVAITQRGATSFGKLQESISHKHTQQLIFQAFDLVYLNGYDLSDARLVDRKQALAKLFTAAPELLRYSDHVKGQGTNFYDQACKLGLEGIVSKRADAPYRRERSPTWLKLKCTQHDEFLVGGYTPAKGARNGFSALLLGAYHNGKLHYTGKVGTGFNARELKSLHHTLTQLEIGESPFLQTPPDFRQARWVKPELVVEIEYSEQTRDGRLRHPRFLAVRQDREPESVLLPEQHNPPAITPQRPRRDAYKIGGVYLTHPDRIMYPNPGITKLDLARFYESIQAWMLPYMANRPLALLRCPDGIQSNCFFQKHFPPTQAGTVPRINIREGEEQSEYAYITSIAHIIMLVQNGVLEFHPWGSQIDDIEHPDVMIFDLDPAPDVAWEQVIHTARALRARLNTLGLKAFLRTTGGKGLHIVVPLIPEADWETVKTFARLIAEQHAKSEPRLLTTRPSKAKRQGKIYIDYLRNDRGATAIAAYSLRARGGAPAAVPLRWDELGREMRPDHYTLDSLRRRLNALRNDPWAELFSARVALSDIMHTLEKQLREN